MPLRIRAVSLGRVFGLNRPSVTYMRGWGETVDVPLIMFVIEGGESPIVVDTGADLRRAVPDHRLPMEQEPEERADAAIRAIGYDPADVRIVVNTHLHWDHCSQNDLFPNARILVQRAELEFAKDPVVWLRRPFEHGREEDASWRRAEDRIEPVDGETVIAPGVTLIPLPGHTPGSQGVLVEAESSRYLLAGDCIDLYDNWHGDAEADHIPSGVFTDLLAYDRSLRRMDGLDAEVVPSHDPLVLERGVFA